MPTDTTTTLNISDARTTPAATRRRARAACIAALAGTAVLGMTVPAAGADVHTREAPRPVAPRLQGILDGAVGAPVR